MVYSSRIGESNRVAKHADCWRHSIDVDHMSPDGPAGPKTYFDGSPFKPLEAFLKEEERKVEEFLKKHHIDY